MRERKMGMQADTEKGGQNERAKLGQTEPTTLIRQVGLVCQCGVLEGGVCLVEGFDKRFLKYMDCDFDRAICAACKKGDRGRDRLYFFYIFLKEEISL